MFSSTTYYLEDILMSYTVCTFEKRERWPDEVRLSFRLEVPGGG